MSENLVSTVDHDTVNAAVDALIGPMELYAEPRREGELDLISVVRQRLEENGLKERLSECYDNNRFIQEAQGKNCCAQQYNLTRWCATQLMATEEDTRLERYSLLYEVNAAEWMTIFDQKILPALVQYDLPVKL